MAFRFFLGGRDLEMVTIRQLLDDVGAEAVDHGLGWGAKAAEYRAEIEEALQQGRTPVLVELGDLKWLEKVARLEWVVDLVRGAIGPEVPGDATRRVWVVDHHDDRAGADQPTSLEQVFRILDLPPERWTRWHALVAANDRGHVRALQALGATRDEIVRVRRADRAAQGITDEQEAAGEEAVRHRRVLGGGFLTVVDLPHNKTAAVCDRMEPALGGPGYRNLLVRCPGEVDFYGEGRWVEWLDATRPGGWKGGNLPEWGYWGITGTQQGLEKDLLAEMTRRGEAPDLANPVDNSRLPVDNHSRAKMASRKRRKINITANKSPA